MTGTSPRLPSARTSSPASRAAAQTSASAAHPGAPSRSKQASCGLTATQAGPACSISERQCAATAAAARSAAGAVGAGRAGPVPASFAGSGSRPRQIWLRRSSTSAASRSANGVGSQLALDLGLQRRAGGEAGDLAARDRDPLAGARVDALAGAALGDVELAEAGEADFAAAAERVGDRVEHGVDRVAGGLLAADPLVACQLIQKLSLCHVEVPPRRLKIGRNLTAGTA